MPCFFQVPDPPPGVFSFIQETNRMSVHKKCCLGTDCIVLPPCPVFHLASSETLQLSISLWSHSFGVKLRSFSIIDYVFRGP